MSLLVGLPVSSRSPPMDRTTRPTPRFNRSAPGNAPRVCVPQAAQRQLCTRCSVTISGLGSGRSNTCRATCPLAIRRTQWFTAHRTGRWIMVNRGIGCFNAAKRLARMVPLTAGLLARRFAKAADPRRLLQPVAGGGWPLLLLFNPRRRSSSASRPVSATTSTRSNPFLGPQCLDNRLAAYRGSDAVSRGCVVGQCHRHVDSYSAVTCMTSRNRIPVLLPRRKLGRGRSTAPRS